MFCQLGNIVFEKSKSPNAISESEDISYAEHSLMNGANRLQPTGRGLRELNLGLFLHVEFSRVADDIAALRKAAQEYAVLPLLWGNGKVDLSYVIMSLNIDGKQYDDLGNLYAATVSISLKEYVVNALQQKQKEADKNAFATGNKKNITGKKAGSTVVTQTCNNHIASASSRLQAVAAKANADTGYFQHTKSPIDAASVSRLASQARAIANDLIVNHYDCIRFEALSETAAVRSTANDLANAAYHAPVVLPASWPLVIATNNAAFQAAVKAFVTQTAAITRKAITRQP